MTVAEWKKKHRKCLYCKHCEYIKSIYEYDTTLGNYMCKAKERFVMTSLPRPFCKLFERKE